MKTDARVRYTKMRIRKAFFACLKEKPVSKITVKEICEGAEINRATFYKHYADPFDLLQKLEEEALAALERTISDCRRCSSRGMLETILENIKDEKNPYALLASENGDPGFAARISGLFYREYRPRMAKELSGCAEEEKDAAYLFVAGGCGNLISAWMKNGMRESPKEAAEQLNRLCNAFVRAYGRG